MKTYTNRFCIDEEDQSEIIGFHQLDEISETSFVSTLIDYADVLVYRNNYRSFRKVKTVINIARKSLRRSRNNNRDRIPQTYVNLRSIHGRQLICDFYP